MALHEKYMQLALDEARKGLGRTAPNPAVGAVVVRDNVILGCGYHKKAGTAHAEVNALANVRGNGHDPRGARMYVTLEPCNHTGRTPPCTEAILVAGIEEVFIGVKDPNGQVQGGGAQYLSGKGVEVTLGVCESACQQLILPFVKHSHSGLPWVLLKAGLSLDGKIAYRKGQGGAITGPEASVFVHQLRNEMDAILIGVGTAAADNPSLTTRLAGGSSRDPLRVVLDTRLRLSPESKMLQQNSSAETWIFCHENASNEKAKELQKKGAKVFRVPKQANDGKEGERLDIKNILATLGQYNLTSLLVEGGSAIHGAFLRAGLVDEWCLIYAPFFIGEEGIPLLQGQHAAQRFEEGLLHNVRTSFLGDDILVQAYARSLSDYFP